MSHTQKDNVALMCDVAELTGLFDSSQGLDAFLGRIISTVAWHMRAAVCSIFLYDPTAQQLVLRANQGLNPDFVNRLRVAIGEGLTGRVLAHRGPVCIGNVHSDPDYRIIPGLYEERYASFLGVPILRKSTPVGVIVLMDPVENYFTSNDVSALQIISSQLAGVIENVRILLSVREGRASSPLPAGPSDGAADPGGTYLVQGRGGGHGVVCGLSTRINHYLHASEGEAGRHNGLTEADFDRALAETERQLLDMQRTLRDRLHEAASLIFDAHVLMLKDEAFSGKIRQRIRGGYNPWAATVEAVRAYAKAFADSPLPAFREKVLDVEDLGRRLLNNLAPDAAGDGIDYKGRIIVAEEVLPSDLLKFSVEGVTAILLLGGGQTSHVAILARALRIPLVFAGDRRLMRLPERTPLLVNAQTGEIVVRPDPEACRESVERAAREKELPPPPADASPAALADGTRVRLLANINLQSELAVANRFRAEGIGLYRTEFPFIISNTFPTEEEQFALYSRVLEQVPSGPVVFRTLDIGGDKALSYFPLQHENNPFLGLRALRFTLQNPEIFRTQLRALIRTAAGTEQGRVKVMFPLVASLDEFIAARELALSCVEELRSEGKHCRLPPLGVMFEIPSAVFLADELATAADFMSIGANDLTQYTLAVDRTNQSMSPWYAPHHPAVLRSLQRIVSAANRAGKPVSFCGNMASNPQMIPFLIGIGLRNLSLDPQRIPVIHDLLAQLTADGAARHARDLLALGRLSEVERYLAENAPSR